MYKLKVLDWNTWNHKILCELFVLDKNTWYLLYTLPLNINGYVPFLKIRWTLFWGGVKNMLTAFGDGVLRERGCLTWLPGKPSIHVTRPTLFKPLEAVPQALTLLGVVRFIAWRLRHPFLRGCRWSPRHFGAVVRVWATAQRPDPP